ncbi:MAG: hypothetical protein FD147_1779 [Chloroflexi bacterium]|nr:MAG: hypothetical protein FD147_1779 [Chloroflexota bacterium]
MNFADHEELAKRQKRRLRRRRNDMVWNLLTGSVLIAMVGLISVMLLVFSNPHIALNPFPPPTMPVLVILPSPTPTLVVMPATWTPTLRATETPPPMLISATADPTNTTTTSALPTTNTTESSAIYPFVLQGAPAEVRSVVFRPETGCEWQGVAGQVVDLQGKPKLQIAVALKGVFNGKTVDMKTISGTHTVYGESGYEFQLSNVPIQSSGSLSIQLIDQSFLPLSDKVIFNTYATCDKNLILINFKQVQ